MRALVVLLSLIASPAAASQTFVWDNYCTPGSLKLCASLSVALTTYVDATYGARTTFSVRLRNLEGVYGSTPWAMYDPTFSDLRVTDFPGDPSTSIYTQSGGVPEFTGSAHVVVSVDSAFCQVAYGLGTPCPVRRGVEFDGVGVRATSTGAVWLSGASTNPNPNGVIGCTRPDDAVQGYHWAWGYFQTCGPGDVSVTFSIPGTWSVTDNSKFSWTGASMEGNSGCTFTSNGVTTCAQVTPEPITMVLVGTGLLGLGGAEIRRRRRIPT